MFTHLLAVLLATFMAQPASQRVKSLDPNERATLKSELVVLSLDRLGWELGAQAWTFRDRTAFEAIDTAHTLGLTCIELFPGQDLSKDIPGAKVGPDLTKDQRDALKKHLKDANIRANSFGVVGFSTDEAAARTTFDFARDMGLRTISAEPEPDAWDLVEKLADEYQINIATHDHPKPSRYWDPQIVLDAVKDRSHRLGACADTGHWTRSGLKNVECLQELDGRVIELHFKDIAGDKDRPWGTGDGDARGVLEELKRQNFKGVILVEYEDGSGAELEANVRKCIEWFDRTAVELAKEAPKR
jgi:sugar phosphate isomerase/epimerase